MTTIFILFAIAMILSAVCPYTSKLGSIFSLLLGVIGTIVFIGLCFFMCDKWWYGLIAIGIYIGSILVTPRVNPATLSDKGRVLSGLGSTVSNILMVVLFLLFFHVI